MLTGQQDAKTAMRATQLGALEGGGRLAFESLVRALRQPIDVEVSKCWVMEKNNGLEEYWFWRR